MTPYHSPDLSSAKENVFLDVGDFLNFDRNDDVNGKLRFDLSRYNKLVDASTSASELQEEENLNSDHDSKIASCQSPSSKGSIKSRKPMGNQKINKPIDMPGLNKQSHKISKDSSEKKEKKKAKIQKTFIGAILLWIWNIIKESLKSMDELGEFIENEIDESYQDILMYFQSREDLKYELINHWSKEISGRCNIDKKRDYKISTRDGLKKKLHEEPNPKLRQLNQIILKIINFFFQKDKYFNRLVSKSCNEESSVEFMENNRFAILEIFMNPGCPPMKCK